MTRHQSNSAWRPAHGLLFLALFAVATSSPLLRVWPLLWLAPLFVYGVLVVTIPPLRATFQPCRFGRATAPAVAATLIIAVGSCAILVAFQLWAHPDVSGFAGFLPVAQLGGVWSTGALFALLNATCEEIIFRQILFDSVEAALGVRMAVITTALLFGYGHMHGYPPGPLGMMLAGVYGLCLGWLRAFSGGLGLPILAHIAADATIFTLLARSGVL